MTEPATEAQEDSRAGKYLTFMLDAEEYGIRIEKVQEILGLLGITRVPRTPHFVRGVVNLRGSIIPIVDLRRKFDMSVAEDTPQTCIIVVRSHGVDVGIVVDSVSEVVSVSASHVEDAPHFGDAVNTDFLLGVGKTGGQVRLLLDIERVLSTDEVVQLRRAGHDSELEEGES